MSDRPVTTPNTVDTSAEAVAEFLASCVPYAPETAALVSALHAKLAEAERERDEANFAFQASMRRTAYLEKTKLGFVEALEACKRGLEAWSGEPHNAKWWRRIDGTPIPNDLLVYIAEIIAQTANADRTERDAALSELAKLKAENARLYDAIGDERESCVDVVRTYRKRAKHSGYWAGYHEDVIAAIRARPLPTPPKDPAK